MRGRPLPCAATEQVVEPMSVSVEIIDGVAGCPAEGIRASVLREVDASWRHAGAGHADGSGGVRQLPALAGRGRYRLVVDLDRYYLPLGTEPFLPRAEVMFRVFHVDEQVHLLVVVTPTSVYACRKGCR